MFFLQRRKPHHCHRRLLADLKEKWPTSKSSTIRKIFRLLFAYNRTCSIWALFKTTTTHNVLTPLSPSDRVAWEKRVPYERSQALEKRLADILGLLRQGRHSTLTLANELDISVPTVARCLTALRRRGYEIKAVKDQNGWSYRLSAKRLGDGHSKSLP
jgi:biotin operon repressor